MLLFAFNVINSEISTKIHPSEDFIINMININTLILVVYDQMELIPDPDPDEEGTKISVSMSMSSRESVH